MAQLTDMWDSIGPYRLLQKIGEGGMGEVFEAEQEKPIRRRVALKIIKRGMETNQVLARFEAERQALAMMDHPCVAKVFDAGETEDGRPYFAMEYVHGVPITEHCDRQRLTTNERLELFILVCEGVQHAHRKALIHRDIKPTNVLVAIQDGRSVPKIIDFGLAKATSQPLTERTVFTAMGQLVGTPAYMSPEQAEMTGQNIDTRTDVYSLGALLYELLAGVPPFDSGALRKAGLDGIRRLIREVEPQRPSSRMSGLQDTSMEVALKRRSTPSALIGQLRGDLDWITMKALEKDRARRYESPTDLAADIKRYLKHEPVTARAPSALYLSAKFLRRHQVGVGTVAAIATSLLIGVSFGIYGLSRPAKAEDAILLEALRKMDWDFGPDHPVTLLWMRDLASSYARAGRRDAAESLYRELLRTLQRVAGEKNSLTVETRCDLAALLAEEDRRAEALEQLGKAMADGYSDPAIAEDKRFVSLHGDPEFEEIVAGLGRGSEDARLSTRRTP